jgi:hypothetical protein
MDKVTEAYRIIEAHNPQWITMNPEEITEAKHR